jgi:zinc/manganese transport system substrate-binding protein
MPPLDPKNKRLTWRRIALMRSQPMLLAAFLIVLVAGCGARNQASLQGAETPKIIVVAAENEYGDIVSQIGGARVHVMSLLINPNTDPHEFEASAADARTVASAQYVIKNGLSYDTWMDKLLSAAPRKGRLVLSVGEFLGFHTGDNPHVWYDPSGWTSVANRIAHDLSTLSPKNKTYFMQREGYFLRSLQPIYHLITTLRHRVKGAPVTATEPVYNYMTAALGMKMQNLDFQRAVMNGTEPAPQAVARIEGALKRHQVRMLFYNSQVIEPITLHMRQLAQQYHVPLVGVTETEPPRKRFQQWQLGELREVAAKFK